MAKEFGRITDEAIAELRTRLGVEHPVPDQFNEYASKDGIRHFAQALGDTNPLFCDEEYAARSRWGCIIAPPTFVESCHGRQLAIGLPGVTSLWAGMELECYAPIKVGERIITTEQFSDIVEKPSKFSRRQLIQTFVDLYRNAKGEVLVKVSYWCTRNERGAASDAGKYLKLSSPQYTKEELDAIGADYEKEELRGATPRYWEDVQEGDQLGTVVKGPLAIRDLIAYKIGARGFLLYCWPHRIWHNFVKRHPAAGLPLNQFGVPDSPERLHYDWDNARHSGFPAPLDYGPQRGAWLCQVVTNWMGDDGFIKKYRCECRHIGLVGDTTWCKGKVARKYVQDGEHLVDIDLWAVDQRGETTMPGSAIVALPTRK